MHSLLASVTAMCGKSNHFSLSVLVFRKVSTLVASNTVILLRIITCCVPANVYVYDLSDCSTAPHLIPPSMRLFSLGLVIIMLFTGQGFTPLLK